jgi:crossover junction endodeoxyribonuclease RuvC|tara:strand:+ start:3587 stop:4081 length:495 start_codon:yes stop_codon:yes gene_type:complete
MITIGIDPGLYGAVGFLKDGEYYKVKDMPIVAKGQGTVKNEVNPSALISFLQDVDHYHVLEKNELKEIMVGLERVNAMPGQGVSGVFSLGDSFGTARSCVAACGYSLTYVAPQSWKKHFKLTSDKEMCRAFATRMFPQAELHLKKHVDRAEALLIARYLYESKV